MVERKLRNRRKRMSKGKAIRVSDLVYNTLNKSRAGRSWDCLFRRLLGLPDRAGNEQILVEGILETTTGRFMLRDPDVKWVDLEADAFEIAITNAARSGAKRVSRPLRMRELP